VSTQQVLPKATTIVLADDHWPTRQGVRECLQMTRGWSVVAEAKDGLEAVQLVERWSPDVLIVDISMPELDGLEVSRQVVQKFTNTRIVILSQHDEEVRVVEALRIGVLGYVLKQARPDCLVQGVSEALQGRRYLSPPLSARAVEAYAAMTAGQSLDPYDALTPREREAIRLKAQGLTYSQIACQMGAISWRTVEAHVINAMRKLGLHTSQELIRYTLRRNLPG